MIYKVDKYVAYDHYYTLLIIHRQNDLTRYVNYQSVRKNKT